MVKEIGAEPNAATIAPALLLAGLRFQPCIRSSAAGVFTILQIAPSPLLRADITIKFATTSPNKNTSRTFLSTVKPTKATAHVSRGMESSEAAGRLRHRGATQRLFLGGNSLAISMQSRRLRRVRQGAPETSPQFSANVRKRAKNAGLLGLFCSVTVR